MIQQTDSKSVLRRYVAAVQAGDEELIRDMFAEDATWTLHAGRLPISGDRRDGTRNLLGAAEATQTEQFLAQSIAWELPGNAATHIASTSERCSMAVEIAE